MIIRGNAAVLLTNPKYPHNVGAVLRACAAYGVRDLRYTGRRMDAALSRLSRVPREERMRSYNNAVEWKHDDKPFDTFLELGYTPIAVEVRENSEMLGTFDHPENALYVFGPEDGGLTNVTLRHCHRFVAIPSMHCLNLSMAVGTVLYDRHTKLNPDARLDMGLTEERGTDEVDAEFQEGDHANAHRVTAAVG